jgi:hypothetical protein
LKSVLASPVLVDGRRVYNVDVAQSAGLVYHKLGVG